MATKAGKKQSANKLKKEASDKQEVGGSCGEGCPDDNSGSPEKKIDSPEANGGGTFQTDLNLETTQASMDATGNSQADFTPAQPPGPSSGGISPRKTKLKGARARRNGISPGKKSVSPSRYRIDKDDPNLLAYEAKVAERKAAERARQEKLDAKAKVLQEEMERRQQEHAEEAARLIEAEKQSRRERHEQAHQMHLESEAARIERLKGVTNADMDLLTGKKSTVAKFNELKEQREREEEAARVAALEQRHQFVQGTTGPTFFEELKEHTDRDKARKEIEAIEREGCRQEFYQHAVVAPLPEEYKTTARKKLLEKEEKLEDELNSTFTKKAEFARRNNTLEYAQTTQKEHKPTDLSNPLHPPPLNTTMPRASKNTMSEGNAAIRGTSPSTLRATK